MYIGLCVSPILCKKEDFNSWYISNISIISKVCTCNTRNISETKSDQENIKWMIVINLKKCLMVVFLSTVISNSLKQIIFFFIN